MTSPFHTTLFQLGQGDPQCWRRSMRTHGRLKYFMSALRPFHTLSWDSDRCSLLIYLGSRKMISPCKGQKFSVYETTKLLL
ncbi:hypothetical protein JAAARDRAFT_345927 [Jaapia argillacea MUCL 33604]|uniref:Uncharacterized protein n=1 Tax=Jaapia argillacea MUCL 33604 TaxID=933084 RepID=A0A067PKB0_9AGAM|nr:hypothetical protein JAAARDRAFT_345927 [Jaapia argillacea MUCL 33604]